MRNGLVQLLQICLSLIHTAVPNPLPPVLERLGSRLQRVRLINVVDSVIGQDMVVGMIGEKKNWNWKA